jgi:hypothetical protein
MAEYQPREHETGWTLMDDDNDLDAIAAAFEEPIVESEWTTVNRPPVPHQKGLLMPSYHNLYITTAEIPRTRVFDLPYGLEISCTRDAGWRLWDVGKGHDEATVIAGEFDSQGLRLDIEGYVIVDSLTRATE